jgi:hypothetical protein
MIECNKDQVSSEFTNEHIPNEGLLTWSDQQVLIKSANHLLVVAGRRYLCIVIDISGYIRR